MVIDVITIFPEMIRAALGHSIVKRAQESGAVEINVHDLRDWTTDRHRSTDDTPYGGGAGMVMRPGPLFAAVESLACRRRRRVILTDAAGRDADTGESAGTFRDARISYCFAGTMKGLMSGCGSIWRRTSFRSAIMF